MKKTLSGFLTATLLAAPLAAADLVPNAAALDGALEGDQSLAIAPALTVADGMTTVLAATMAFTRPSTALNAPDAEDKLSIAADSDGAIKVSNAGAWTSVSGVTAPAGEALETTVQIAGRLSGGALVFDVTVGQAETLTVAATASGATLSELILEGEGSTSGLSLAAVSTGILPAGDGGAQSADLVAAYADWLNDPSKGAALGDASDAEKAAAFAMNVGGTPALAITAIDLNAKTLTVKGSYLPSGGTESVDAPLDAIRGTLYLTWAPDFGATPTVETADFTVEADKTATLALPENARFVKATVALAKPEATL